MKGQAKKICAAALAVCIAASAGIIASAAEAQHKEEVVYVNMDASGSVSGVYVVNICYPVGGVITDYGSYDSASNMTTTDKVELSGGVVTIRTDADKVYYKGVMRTAQLPWKIGVSYWLDGQNRQPEELAGASGRLKIVLDIKKNDKVNSVFFDNYAVQAAVTLDADRCVNIDAPGATAANAGGNKQFSYIVLPGNEGKIELSADVTDFEMPAISINGVAMKLELSTGSLGLGEGDLSGLTDGVDKLDDGAKELDSGAAELLSGVRDLKKGTSKLSGGVGDLYTGAQKLRSGMFDVYEGFCQLSSGMTKYTDGAKQLAAGNTQLLAGAKQIVDATFSTVTDQLRANLEPQGYTVPELTLTNYVSVLGGIGGVTDAMRASAKAGLRTQINSALSAAGKPDISDAELSVLLVLANSVLTADSTLTTAQAIGEAQRILSSAAANAGTLTAVQTDVGARLAASESPALISYVDAVFRAQIYTGNEAAFGNDPANVPAENVAAAYDSAVASVTVADSTVTTQQAQLMVAVACKLLAADTTGTLTFANALTQAGAAMSDAGRASAAQNTVASDAAGAAAAEKSILTAMVMESGGLNTLATQMAQVKAQLDGIASFYNGLVAYTSGVSGLASGAANIKDGFAQLGYGMSQLTSATSQMRSGVGELKDGATELDDGVGDLLDGVVDLKSGTAEFSDGTGEFKDKTSGLEDSLGGLLGGDFDIVSFTSPKNENVTSVQFVMQTAPIEKPEAAADDAADTAPQTFWERVLALFGK